MTLSGNCTNRKMTVEYKHGTLTMDVRGCNLEKEAESPKIWNSKRARNKSVHAYLTQFALANFYQTLATKPYKLPYKGKSLCMYINPSCAILREHRSRPLISKPISFPELSLSLSLSPTWLSQVQLPSSSSFFLSVIFHL